MLTGGIVAQWGLDKAVLSLCAARICRMVLAQYVREEVEENLLTRAAQLSRAAADQVIEDYGKLLIHTWRGKANWLADCDPGGILPRPR